MRVVVGQVYQVGICIGFSVCFLFGKINICYYLSEIGPPLLFHLCIPKLNEKLGGLI